MTYLRTNKKSVSGGLKMVYAILGTLLLLLILSQILYSHFLPSIFTSMFRPFWSLSFSIDSGALDSRESLLQENEQLKIKMSEYDVRLATIRAIEEENASLKSILGREKEVASTSTSTNALSYISRNVGDKILSAVLMRPPMSMYDQYIVDVGSDSGVKVGSLVYASGNVLIGKVVDVLDDTSKVVLFSSPGEKYEVNIGANSEHATAYGRGGGQYEASLPRDISVKDGDFVTIPSIHGLPLGIVTAVLSDPAEPFVTVLFTSSVNIYNTRWVLIDR